jgi:hypothetical protein
MEQKAEGGAASVPKSLMLPERVQFLLLLSPTDIRLQLPQPFNVDSRHIEIQCGLRELPGPQSWTELYVTGPLF